MSSSVRQRRSPLGVTDPSVVIGKALNLGYMLPLLQYMIKQKSPLNIHTLAPKLLNCQIPSPPFPLPSQHLNLPSYPQVLFYPTLPNKSPEGSLSIVLAFNLETKFPNPITTTKIQLSKVWICPKHWPLAQGARDSKASTYQISYP